ncbi:hypothetical protein Cni_G23834 [Canna indica]|uniref:AB hydrolase-1 domain-containing protein n=1 Tax=Canna indica TaxID=4628 RepID=A0AAQ3KXX9_9LILI|nr:hypothetical protein Cni_G23834 [Canna indica]
MAPGGKGCLERIRRGFRTAFFMLAMVASLLVLSTPLLVALGDVLLSLALTSTFACERYHGFRGHLKGYGFRSSLVDIPLVSIVRSLAITCVYSLCDSPGPYSNPYFATALLCSLASVIILSIKACVFNPISNVESEASPSLSQESVILKNSWGLPVLFISSLLFALGHVVVAYRTSCRARRKLLLHRVDPEVVLACNVFCGYKIPRSPTPCSGKYSKSDREIKRRTIVRQEHELPISFLADVDSLFIACEGLMIHYKLCLSESPFSRSLVSSTFHESSPDASPRSISSGWLKIEKPLILTSKTCHHLNRSFSNQSHNSSLYAPLLVDTANSSNFSPDSIPAFSLDDVQIDECSSNFVSFRLGVEERGKTVIVLVHGFGGGVFSWRHVMSVLARHVGCPVVAFDRPGWGLTSRPRKKDWEEKQLPNPYKLESQADLLISFCLEMGFQSVIFVGHDDGGILALKAAEKIQASIDSTKVEVKGVVLVSVSLSREVIPAFARILLQTSLGKKHMVRPLLRTEITQVINRRAWYDATKLTPEVMNLYKAPLFVEGWDEALHEVGRLSFSTVLSPQEAASLLKSVENLPILVIAGAEDALVPLKSTQAMALKLLNSRLVAISGCGHLPHEECPKALLAALSPFITRLLSSLDVLHG